jgi:hypothetical protein
MLDIKGFHITRRVYSIQNISPAICAGGATSKILVEFE